jgi:REP-associated tyrosine transposase
MRRRSQAQRELELAARRTWGGRRAGAGRKPGPHRPVPHRPRAGLTQRYPMHVTLKLRTGIPSLRSVTLVREIERSFRAGCDRGDFRLVHYSLLSNHAHLIVEAADASALARGMKAIGSRLARAVNRVLGRRGPVLLERFHLRVLRTPLEVRRVLAYVLLNARGHAARAARALGIDPASSGRWFDGWCRCLRAATGCAPIAAPRTWLLQVGWRRHGLIDPDETPGRPRASRKRCGSHLELPAARDAHSSTPGDVR